MGDEPSSQSQCTLDNLFLSSPIPNPNCSLKMLIARSLLRAAPTRIAQPAFSKPVLTSSTSQWLRYKSDRPSTQKPGGFRTAQDLQYDPAKRLQRQQAKQDAASEQTAELDGGATPSRNTAPD